MANKKKTITVLFVLVLLLLLVPTVSCAWDYGGDADWGGDGGGGYVGDSDWSGDSDWGWSDGSSGSVSFHPGGAAAAVGAAVIFIVIVVIVFKTKKGGNSGTLVSPLHMSDTSCVNLHNLELLKQRDPAFSEAAMLSRVEHLFISSQVAYASQDYEPMRPFFSNAIFEQHVKQIQDKKARGERNVVSEMAVLGSKLENFSEDGHNEYLDIWLRVKYKSYIGRIDNPDIVVSGSKTKTFYIDFRWQFTRSAGGQTRPESDAVQTGICPNCGAPINLNQSGKCEYCGSVISTTEYDWVLSKIDALQQRSTGS